MPVADDLPRGAHVFIDETKARDYLMVGVWIAPDRVPSMRLRVRELLLAGRFRLHFHKERDVHRKRALETFLTLGIVATVVRIDHGHASRDARGRALTALLGDAVGRAARRVVIEVDESLRQHDLQVARPVLGPETQLVHLRASQEPLLWVSDGIAWSLQRGGAWAAAVEPLIAKRTELS